MAICMDNYVVSGEFSVKNAVNTLISKKFDEEIVKKVKGEAEARLKTLRIELGRRRKKQKSYSSYCEVTPQDRTLGEIISIEGFLETVCRLSTFKTDISNYAKKESLLRIARTYNGDISRLISFMMSDWK
jgi:hypothetical protein